MSKKIFFALGASFAAWTLPMPGADAAAQPSSALVEAQSKGQALMAQGEHEAAIRHLKQAEELAEEPSAQLLSDLSTWFNATGNLRNSESYARRASEVAQDPGDRARALNLLGISLFSKATFPFRPLTAPDDQILKQASEAESAFREVLEITGGREPVVWYNLAGVLKLHARYRQANDAFVEYLKRSPDGPNAAQARRAMEWIACMQAFSGPESSNDESATTSGNAQGGPLRIGGEVEPPRKIRAPQPGYTKKARRERIQGRIFIEALIDKNGDVRCLEVVRGLPMGLTEAAERR